MVAMGRWLVAGFDTLLCFDPTRGIDVGTKHQIYDLFRELADAGRSVLMFTSELREVPLACDRVLVMYAGRIVAELPSAEADEATLLNSAHGLAETLADQV
jgi:ribose transport system ATP-binding protein